MKNIFVSDVDGTTLLKGEIEFTYENKKAFKSIIDGGNLFICASGRTYRNLYKIFEQNEDVVYVAENGNLVVYKDQILLKNKFESKLDSELIRYLSTIKGNEILVSTPSCAFYYQDGDIYLDEEETPREVNFSIEEFISYIGQEIIKISIYREKIDKEFKEIYNYLKENYKNIEVFDANNQWIDISPRNGNKGEAIKFIIDYFKLKDFNLYVFGDGENDISMLKLTKNSYCPKHALEIVKKNSTNVFTDFALAVSSILASLK